MILGSSTRRRVGAAFLAFAAALVLAGCGPSSAGLNADTARGLQSTVAQVRQAAGGGDFASALTALDQLAADVERSAGEGRIGPEQRARITEAIAVVRADVQARLDAAKAPPASSPAQPESTQPPAPEQKPGKGKPDEPGSEGKGKGRN